MGKYMRKAKATTREIPVDLSSSSLGVRTRARTLAIQRLQQLLPPPPPPSPPAVVANGSFDNDVSYLQLRSRRLEKPPLSRKLPRQPQAPKLPPALAPRETPTVSKEGPVENESVNGCGENSACSSPKVEIEEVELVKKDDEGEGEGLGENHGEGEEVKEGILIMDDEASFGENCLEMIEARERGSRETTPCSLIRDCDTALTPGSSTRPTSSTFTDRRMQNALTRIIPTAREMDDFFADAEQQQQKVFMEKYNFDPVKDSPLPGAFEWERVDA